MIQIITYQEKNKNTHKMETWISHGVDTETGRNVVMEQVKLNEANYVVSHPEYGLILKEKW